MALWAKVQQLPPESLLQIRAIYGEHFPIEVRHYLAQWIEERFWSDIEPVPDNPQHQQYVAGLLNSLLLEIQNNAMVITDSDFFLTKLKLIEAANIFRQRYSANPMQLFNYVRQCLAAEMRLIQSASGEGLPDFENIVTNGSGAEIMHTLEILKMRTRDTAEDVRRLREEHEAIEIQYHTRTKLNDYIQLLNEQPANPHATQVFQKIVQDKKLLEQSLPQKVAELLQSHLTLMNKLKETVQMLNTLQAQVLGKELRRWKREQQLSGNGAIFNSNLDTIQEWCESLAELIWSNRQQIKEVELLENKLSLRTPGVSDVLPQLLNEITQLLSSLVNSTFIIEKQPPQVMRTITKFTATVRLLVGGKLNIGMTPPRVKVTIISESQASILLKNNNLEKNHETSGKILNNTGTMQYQEGTQLSVTFQNMQLKQINRKIGKKGTESVMDQKFFLLFQAKFSVGGGELEYQVCTLSLPVVVIVHTTQEPHAWATVTWDNAFSKLGRVSFDVPDKVPWSNVAKTLSLKFKDATGRPLTEENLQFLGEKAFKGNFTEPNQMISWVQFCKEPLKERNFSFWEWFYAVMKLTHEYLRGPWVEGAILGFIRKTQTNEILQCLPNGTFLLRFSDSELGGVTIAWVSQNSKVFMLQPFTSKDFVIRSLADRISDLSYLNNLYPAIPKDVVFNKYCTSLQVNQPTSKNGYVKPIIITYVPGWSGFRVGNDLNTPQHPFLQLPIVNRCSPIGESRYPDSATTLMADIGLF